MLAIEIALRGCRRHRHDTQTSIEPKRADEKAKPHGRSAPNNKNQLLSASRLKPELLRRGRSAHSFLHSDAECAPAGCDQSTQKCGSAGASTPPSRKGATFVANPVESSISTA